MSAFLGNGDNSLTTI